MGRKSKADERRPEILKHAYKVAVDEGLQRTTLNRIAESMGVAPSLLTHYFKSKDDIIVSLIHYMVEIYDTNLLLDFRSIQDPIERVEAILDARLWEYSRLVLEDRVWYEAFALSFTNPKVRESLQGLYRRDLETLAVEFGYLVPVGTQDPSVETVSENLSRMILIMMEGINYYDSVTGDEIDINTTVSAIKEMLLSYIKTSLSM